MKKGEGLAHEVIRLLMKKKLTLATAESITGGGLSAALTDVAGASEVFLGGIVSYSDGAKKKFLGVLQRTLTKESAVSESVVRTMAESARVQFATDFAIATTGVAGPGKAYGQKAGTVWIAIASRSETIAVALEIAGDRATVRHATIESALATFTRILSA